MEGKRVFEEDIGSWPEVYETGPGRFEVIASHTDPARVGRTVLLSNIPPALFSCYLLPMMTFTNWGFVVIGAIIGWLIIYRIARLILTQLPFLVDSNTRVKFDKGEVKWGKFRIAPDMPRQFRSDRHREASADIRRLQKTSDKTALPTFSLASTVFIDSGEGWMHSRPVASIANDESGEKSHLLATVLRFVDKRSQAQAEPMRRTKSRAGID